MKTVLRLIIVFFFTITSSSAQNWEGVGSEFPASIRSVYFDSINNYLYASGDFDFLNTEGRRLKGIARWDGLKWDSLGTGIDNAFGKCVFALYNNELYVGGSFDSAGSVYSKCISKWDGVKWDSLPVNAFVGQVNSGVYVLESIDGDLYLGGEFDSLMNSSCLGVAKWNGINWTCLNFPALPYTILRVYSICKYQNEIYFGGLFKTTNAPNDTIQDIIKFDGMNWKSVGGGFHSTPFSGVSSMKVFNGELYVAGAFSKMYGDVGNYIQKWDGNVWTEVGGGVIGIAGSNGSISDLIVYDNKLYAVGVFSFAGGVPAQYIAAWDGVNWCGFGSIFDNIILTACVYDSTICIGGGFLTVDNDTVNKIAKWIGGNYVDTCGHIVSGVNEITNYNSFFLYPNPAQSIINIEFENSISESYTLNIVNVLGETVYFKQLNDPKLQISVDDFPSGIYIVQVQNEKGIWSKKFIKQ
ncbi:MAG: T9SS type A sorting domain-containing protein [Bacteroidetes bacterium]|nr:T9SS type A sorting domain-containing protein [Bacteroidota bacterium]